MTERRYTQAIGMTEKSDPKRYDLGRRQAQCAIERYHFLCAAAQEAYTLHNPGAFRSELTFEKYTAYPLTPVSAKLHPRKDGTIHPGDIEIYVKCMVRNFKCSEGGIMYCLGDERSFWNMVINYHSSAKTSGIKAWDRLFKQLKASGYDKGIIPCMFFATPFGCNDPSCPFLHDKEKSVRARERILARRRTTLGKPTPRDIAAREKAARKAYEVSQRQVVPYQRPSVEATLDDDDDDDIDPELMKIYEESTNIKAICNNPVCLQAKMKRGTGAQGAAPVKMKACAGCQMATYCSKECQTADWKRHKKEPCRPFEEIVEDDNMWDDWGLRVGTGRFNSSR